MKKILVIEKDCNNWKRLWWLKKIVIIDKDCDNWKRLIKKVHASNKMNLVVM